MILYRGTTEYEQDTKKDVIFQTVDWDCEDAIFDEDEDENNNEKPWNTAKFDVDNAPVTFVDMGL